MSTIPETPDNSASSTTQFREGLPTALASADAAVSQTVQNLKLVQQARLSQLTRTAASLKKQYGAGDAAVQAAEAAVNDSSAKIARLAAVHQQLDTAAPEVAPTGWALHGRVFNAALQPLSGLTVFLVDSTKVYQKQFGYAYTNSSGYFLLNHPGGTTAAPSSGQTASAANADLYIQISSKSGKPLFLGTDGFHPTLGRAVYQTITLPSGEQPLGDPPADVRGTVPPGKKQKRQVS